MPSAMRWTLVCLALLGVCLCAQDEWEEIAIVTPVALKDHTCTAVGDDIYVFGGSDGGAFALGDMYHLDMSDVAALDYDILTSIETGEERTMHSANYYASGNSIYVFGGYTGYYMDTLYSYSIGSDTWTERTSTPPPALRGHVSGIIGSYLYVFSGTQDGVGSTNDMYRYTLPNGPWVTVSVTVGDDGLPGVRSHAAATVLDSCLYVYGGQNTMTYTIMSDLWRYCPSLNEWEEMTPSAYNTVTPPALHSFGMVAVDSRLVISMGYTGDYPNDVTNLTHIFDVTAGVWTEVELASLPDARYRHCFATTSSYELVVLGGTDGYDVQDALLVAEFSPLSCAPGTYSPTGLTCEDCPAGSYTDEYMQYECKPCTSGHYCLEGTDTPTECPTGTWSGSLSLASSAECTDCVAGTYNSMTGQTDISACVSCEGGSYATDPSTESCTPCPAGTASSSTGATLLSACVACEAGEYAAEGSTSCSSCSAGTISTDPPSATCDDCPSGTTSLEGTDTCTDCLSGTYAASAGSPLCSPCASGTYQPSEGQASCIDCLAGRRMDIATTGSDLLVDCELCAIGTAVATSGYSGDTCPVCPAGEYQTDTGQATCDECPVGTYNPSTGSTTQDDCLSCPAGTHNDSTGGSSLADCSDCAAGVY
ncbi:hypothetical protein KIPB_006941 [Kipferlia bialata]|uniref:Tyrosine-protein kinase ephrin type A/B receptor-like domain-containing protein n=1 Tax=Kipferlia bialata TaxID=797122 RepID=A0A9K3CXU4_9EUKA|nr:hypothetical protein KIPB_006941 [Kipferlia bialata]|eukprot:g6941.t1